MVLVADGPASGGPDIAQAPIADGADVGLVMVRIDQADADDGRPDADDTPSPNAPRRLEAPDPRNPQDAAARVAIAAEARAEVDAVYRANAIDQGYARVRDLERGTVTPAMKQIEAEDPDRQLVGLEHSLKGKDRLTEKVNEAVGERGHSVEAPLGMVKDAIR
jgi:hypothetical protein